MPERFSNQYSKIKQRRSATVLDEVAFFFIDYKIYNIFFSLSYQKHDAKEDLFNR